MNTLTPSRAPALYLVPGIILGLLLAKETNAPTTLLISGAIAALTYSLWVTHKNRSETRWFLSFTIGTSLAFWSYGTLRLPAKPDAYTLSLPQREATLTIDVKRVLNPLNTFHNTSGIARVTEAGSTSPVQAGANLYFRVKVPVEDRFTLQRGQRLQLTGVLHPIVVKDNDSFEAYLKDIGIHYTFVRTSMPTVIHGPSIFDRFCMSMNERFEEYLRLGAPNNTHLTNIYVAMLLGKKGALSDEQNERFRMTGTMHFFAISGLHIGVIATVIAQCLLVIRVPRRYSPWIGLPLLYLYVEITGASPSAVRAFLMAACFWASFALVRQRSPLSALATSAVAVLLIAPEQLWSLGFQLSYTVVLSILLFGLPLKDALSQRARPYQLLPEADWSIIQHGIAWSFDKCLLLFCISLSAWLGSAPLSAGLFGYIAPGAILLNMLLVYLAAIAISGGVIGLSLATLGLPSICSFINHSAWVCLFIMDTFVQLSLKIPASVIVCEGFPSSVSYLGVIGYIGILFWLHTERSRFQTTAVGLAPAYICAILLLGIITSG